MPRPKSFGSRPWSPRGRVKVAMPCRLPGPRKRPANRAQFLGRLVPGGHPPACMPFPNLTHRVVTIPLAGGTIASMTSARGRALRRGEGSRARTERTPAARPRPPGRGQDKRRGRRRPRDHARRRQVECQRDPREARPRYPRGSGGLLALAQSPRPGGAARAPGAGGARRPEVGRRGRGGHGSRGHRRGVVCSEG